MPSVVDSLSIISKTMSDILDFVAQDEVLSKDFQQYLEINEIEIETEKDFNNVIIQYMLDMKMQNGLRVLEYFRRNNKTYDEIINALENSICAIFRIDRILSNAYETTCLCSNAQTTLIPMVKMNHLKQIGKNDFIAARVIELAGSQYILEIYEIISEFDVYGATLSAIKYMLQNPKIAHYKNKEKRIQLEKSVSEFYQSFKELFGKEFIITTNRKVDKLIEFFNNYRLDKKDNDYSSLIEKVEKNRFLKINELETEESKTSFLEIAVGGFGAHKETYDIALWIDKKRGLYVIPFFETFLKCFKEDIEGKNDCIREFLVNDKVPPSVIKYVCEKEENFFEVVNNVLNTDFSTLEELLFNTKAAYVDEGVFSSISVLFNSELFSTIINFKEEEKDNSIKRNEPCPCGSGLKYKKCCGKN